MSSVRSRRPSLAVCATLLAACTAPAEPQPSPTSFSEADRCLQAFQVADTMKGDLRGALDGLRHCRDRDRAKLAGAEILLNLGDEAEAEQILMGLHSEDPELDMRRILLRFAMARKHGDNETMGRLAEAGTSKYGSDPQVRIMRGVVLCVSLHCKDGINDLELAREQVQMPLGTAYLMAAYADAGRIQESVHLLDELRSEEPIQTFDTFLLYAGVYAYLKSGRKVDAEALYSDFIAAFPGAETNGFVWRAHKLINEGLPKAV